MKHSKSRQAFETYLNSHSLIIDIQSDHIVAQMKIIVDDYFLVANDIDLDRDSIRHKKKIDQREKSFSCN
jgi:hypothetical protein